MTDDKPQEEEAPLTLIHVTDDDGADWVAAYLRVGDQVFAGAGDDVLPAIEDAFGLAFPDKQVQYGPELELPSKDELPTLDDIARRRSADVHH